MSRDKIAVLGGGNVGFATTAELASAGLSVNLFELREFGKAIEPIVKTGSIQYSGVAGEGRATPKLVTTDIEAALDGVDLIILAAPVFAHETFVEVCLPFLRDGQVLLTETAYFACLRFARRIQQAGKQVILAELNQSPYTCTKKGPAHIFIDAKRDEAFVAALPASTDITDRLRFLKAVWPNLTPAANVLCTSLDNMNWIAHPPITLLHRGLIERSEEYYLPLKDAIPRGVVRLMEAMEADRVRLGNAFGVELPPIKHTFERGGETLEEAIRLSTEFGTFGYDYRDNACPYLTEDLRYALPAIVSLADQVAVPVPAMGAVLHLFSIIDDVDYLSEGLNVDKMGIGGMTLSEIRRLVQTGF